MNSEKIKELLKQSSDYWERRSLSTALNAIENEEDYLKRLKGVYDRANQDIQDKLAVVYTRYAKNNNISLTEAYSKLPKDMETKYKADVEEYVRLATEHQGDPKWKQYLLNQSLMHKHSVLNQLQTEYRKVVYDIDMEQTGGKFLEKIYTNTDYYNQYLNGNDEQFAKVDKDRIQRLIAEDWSGGGGFSEKIWGNKEKLIKALDETVIKGFATGQSYDSLAKDLSKKMDTSYSNAQRLIMTESARMDNQALLDRYREMGATKLEFVATLDMKTSEICRAMDGTIIEIENAKIGLNVPPLHPYCRSVIAPVVEDDKGSETRMYRDPETGKSKKGKLKTYKDYLEKVLGDKKSAEALASKQNDLRTLVSAINVINEPATPISNSIENITGYEQDTRDMERIEKYRQESIERAKELDPDIEKKIDKAFNELKKKIENKNNEVSYRIFEKDLEKVLDSNKIANRFETNTSNIKTVSNTVRAEGENMLFNIPLNALAKNRPVYGYLEGAGLFNNMDRLVKYGDIRIVLKNSVKARSTFTYEDSLNGRAVVRPTPLNNIGKQSFRYYDLSDYEKGYHGMEYREVQIFGKITLKDIEYIEIPKIYKTNKNLMKKLSKKGIKIKWK